MVTTRSQSNRQHGKKEGRSPSRYSVNSSNSSHHLSGGEGAQKEKQIKPPPPLPSSRRHTALELLQLEASRASGGTSTQTPDGAAGGGELLGRGHRVSREIRTLDEEYLASSYYGHDATHAGSPSAGGRRGLPSSHPPVAARSRQEADELVIRERYPPRAAAQRALSNLQHTLEDQDKDETSSSSSSAPSSPSSSATSQRSRSRYNFRHHPEIGDRIKRGLSASSTESSDSSSSSSSEEAHEGDRARPRRQDRIAGEERSARGRNSGGSGNNAASSHAKRGREPSLDSSISNESMREASVEELARQDAKEHKRLTGAGSVSESGSSEDDEVVTERDMKRALRHAKESTARNTNINHYMEDAIGDEDPRKARRRRVDRRYRHLLMLDEEEKLNSAGGGGGGGDGGGSGGSGGGGSGDGSGNNGALGDITPLKVDGHITFDSVGGLPGHIVALREMVLLPLLYPNLLKGMNLSPPRGVLFVGPPGTGKTLMARALAVEGSRCSQRPVAFFMRKGADLLSKWVGESERQLRLLFEEARRLQPSIIFFDEIDGLAPTRHTKTEQTQAALVATLLALLDGLDDRGQVVVIGATNRPDTIDPALRRPGRFDRELTFPLPDAAARRHILNIMTAKQTFTGASDKTEVIEELVTHTEGYSGADLKALCTEAGLNRLRTALPQLYTTSKKLVLPYAASSAALAIRKEDFFAAARRINPSMQRGGQEMHLTHMDEHLEKLFHGARESLLASLASVYTTVARALAKERRDCSDLGSAVRHLSSFPVPYARHALLLFLQVAQGTDTSSAPPPERPPGPTSGARGTPAVKGAVESARTRQHKAKGRSSSSSASSHPSEAAPLTVQPATGSDVTASMEAAAAQMVLVSAAVAMIRGLPAFQTFSVHLPHTHVAFAGTAGGVEEGATARRESAMADPGFSGGGHLYQLVQAVQRCSPCIVLLRGAEEWLRDQGLPLPEPSGKEADTGAMDPTDSPQLFCEEEYQLRAGRMAALRYYLNLLSDTEAILIIPCASERTRQAFLGQRPAPAFPSTEAAQRGVMVDGKDGVATRLVSSSQHQLHPHFTVLSASVQPVPTQADLESFVAHVYRTIALAFRVQSVMARRTSTTSSARGGGHDAGGSPYGLPLPEDRTQQQPEAPSREAQRVQYRQALELWRKVEYRRLQLRHVLLKWVSQLVNSGRFKLLLSADLDLPQDSPTLKEWRRHTKHTRIGLDDILERLESESYTCLSQFHDDIDQLVRNVRSFFRSRAQYDQRYRLRALELKETTVLNMYKLNRNVVRFCEANRDVVEPSPPVSLTKDSEEGESGDEDAKSNDTGLLAEDRDPAGGSSQTLHFRQRPPAPVKPRRKFRIFGQRRRRRRAPLAVKKPLGATQPAQEQQAHTSDSDDDSVEEAGPYGAHEGAAERDEQQQPKLASKSASTDHSRDEESEREGAQEAHGEAVKSPFSSPLSPIYPPDEEVEAWAVALLRGRTYHELHEVFQLVMQELDAEVRRRDGESDPSLQPHSAALTTTAEEGDSPSPKPVAAPRSDSRSSGSSRSSRRDSGKLEARCDTQPPLPPPQQQQEGEEEKPEMFFARTLSVAAGKVRRLHHV